MFRRLSMISYIFGDVCNRKMILRRRKSMLEQTINKNSKYLYILCQRYLFYLAKNNISYFSSNVMIYHFNILINNKNQVIIFYLHYLSAISHDS